MQISKLLIDFLLIYLMPAVLSLNTKYFNAFNNGKRKLIFSFAFNQKF